MILGSSHTAIPQQRIEPHRRRLPAPIYQKSFNTILWPWETLTNDTNWIEPFIVYPGDSMVFDTELGDAIDDNNNKFSRVCSIERKTTEKTVLKPQIHGDKMELCSTVGEKEGANLATLDGMDQEIDKTNLYQIERLEVGFNGSKSNDNLMNGLNDSNLIGNLNLAMAAEPSIEFSKLPMAIEIKEFKEEKESTTFEDDEDDEEKEEDGILIDDDDDDDILFGFRINEDNDGSNHELRMSFPMSVMSFSDYSTTVVNGQSDLHQNNSLPSSPCSRSLTPIEFLHTTSSQLSSFTNINNNEDAYLDDDDDEELNTDDYDDELDIDSIIESDDDGDDQYSSKRQKLIDEIDNVYAENDFSFKLKAHSSPKSILSKPVANATFISKLENFDDSLDVKRKRGRPRKIFTSMDENFVKAYPKPLPIAPSIKVVVEKKIKKEPSIEDLLSIIPDYQERPAKIKSMESKYFLEVDEDEFLMDNKVAMKKVIQKSLEPGVKKRGRPKGSTKIKPLLD